MTDYGLRTLHWRSIPQVGAGKGDSYTEGLGIGVKGWMGWIEDKWHRGNVFDEKYV